MSVKSAASFIDKARTNKDIANDLKAVDPGNISAAIRKIVKVAAKHGYTFTEKEYGQAAQVAQEKLLSSSHLHKMSAKAEATAAACHCTGCAACAACLTCLTCFACSWCIVIPVAGEAAIAASALTAITAATTISVGVSTAVATAAQGN
jgi:hypothetical protein